MTPISPEALVQARAPADKALEQMQATGRSRLLVVDQGRLVGMVTLKDLLHMLSLKMQLEDF